MTGRRRNGLILLLVAGLFAVSAIVIVAEKTRLGLDLAGGVQLVYQGKPTPQQPKVTPGALDRAVEIIRERVDALGVSEPEIERFGSDELSVGLAHVKNAQRAQKQVGKVAQMFFYDWEPNLIKPDGTQGVTNQGQVPPLSGYQAVMLASKRKPQHAPWNTTGDQYYLVNPKTKQLDTKHSPAQSPGDSRRDLLSELPRQRPPPGWKVVKVPRGTVVVAVEADQQPNKHGQPTKFYVLNDHPAMSGKEITNPKQQSDNGAGGTGEPIVTFDFTDKGRKIFQDVTRAVAQRGQRNQVPGQPAQASFQHFGIVLDQQAVSVPYIDYNQNPDGIDGRTGAQISGGFTIGQAQDLAKFLEIGALPIRLKLISQSQVSASLGKQALHQGLLAGAVGLLLTVLFLLAFYRVLGLIASLALGIYAIYFFALIKLIPITLTLPGIAGLILTIGVAADANIVIFERVKEEIRAGRSVPAGIAQGYKRGFSSIVDANVVTIMTAFILFILATAGVKGFALTLGIGTLVSLFTAVLATQAALGAMGRSRLITHPSALGFRPKRGKGWSRFDFMGASKWFFSMSGTILLVGALAVGGKGLNLGIDFTSGTRITTGLDRAANENQVRDVMSSIGYADAKIQRASNAKLGHNVFQISTKTLQPAKVETVRSKLDQRFGVGNKFTSRSVGPTFGKTVANSAIIAIIASLLVISAYVALRFEWKYAVPVLIALMHDLLITAGVYSLTGREVTTSTVAALLTILGYSMYDTIIVFDRVRENVPRMPRAAFTQIVNRSMAEVLTRSLATSLSTLLPIGCLLFFGGDTLKDFAFALLVGVASGAYSSIFIASPVLTHWKEREAGYARRRVRIMEQFGGQVPAYAVASAGAPADVEPPQPKKRRTGRLTAPEPEEISKDEFEDLVADLDVDLDGEDGDAKAARDLTPEEVDAEAAARVTGASSATAGPAKPKPKRDKSKRQRNKRHGRGRR